MARFAMRAISFFILLLAAGCGGPGPEPIAVSGIVSIGAVQGVVGDADVGILHESPMAGRTVRVKALVHQLLMWPTRKGEIRHGMLLQNLPGESDETVLLPGMTFHFMPGLWMEDWGLEITETLLIRENGPAECLADVPRRLVVKD